MRKAEGHKGGKPTLKYNPKARLDQSQMRVYGMKPNHGIANSAKDPATPKPTGPRPRPKRK